MHDLIKKYWELGWNVIPLRGKQPFTAEWQTRPFPREELLRLVEEGRVLNVGVTTGALSGVIAVDVDQPEVIGFDAEPAIRRGALAHSTSKAPRLIFRSSSPEVLGFSRKVTLTREEWERLTGKKAEKEKVTLIEILGEGRQFVVPPSIHPRTLKPYEWLTPLPEKSEDILEVSSLEELRSILGECIREKWVLDELFERGPSGSVEAEGEFLREVLRRILEALGKNFATELSRWYLFHCPFHPPDRRASFAINKEKLYAVDYHDDQVFNLVELARELGVELPERRAKVESKYPAPEGWVVDDTGVYREVYTRKGESRLIPVCFSPVRVVGRGKNIDSGEVYLKLAWKDVLGEEHVEIFPQAELYTKRGVMSLLPGRGVEINENRARELVDYITASVREFADRLETFVMMEKQGWKDKAGFALGSVLYGKRGELKVLLLHEDLFGGIAAKGEVEEWLVIAAPLLSYKRARFKVYASCTAPLLRLLGVQSFIVDDYGETSTGKTTTCELAMSIWGNPRRLEMSANATKVGIERLASAFCDLPIFLDETSLVGDKQIQEAVYMLANETGRLRGSKSGGLQKVESWKTVVFTTGEKPLVAEESFAGMRTRVIELYGGLGERDPEAVRSFKEGVKKSYGVVAPLLIKKIMSYSGDELLETYEEARGWLVEEEALSGRPADALAAITCGGVLFEEIVEEHGFRHADPTEVVLQVLREMKEEIRVEDDYCDRFLANLRGWIVANMKSFYGVDYEEVRGKEVFGRIDESYVDIFPHVLKGVMQSWRLNYRRILRDLVRKGIIKTNHGLQYETRFGNEKVRVVRFVRQKLFES
jgi:uncharacterized protein (DUF927 family)